MPLYNPTTSTGLSAAPSLTATNTVVPTASTVTQLTLQQPVLSASGVTWVNTNASETVVGNRITRTAAGTGFFVTGGSSSENITTGNSGYAYFTCDDLTGTFIAGLGLTFGLAASNVDFGFYLLGSGTLQTVEGGIGTNVSGGYIVGTVLKVSIEAGVVKYYKDGTLIRTSSGTPSYPQKFIATLANQNATVAPYIVTDTSVAQSVDILSINSTGGSPLSVINNKGWIGAGTSTPAAQLHVVGSVQFKRTSVTANYTALSTDYYLGVNGTAAGITITIPATTANEAGRLYVIKDESGAAATKNITLSCSQTMDNATTQIMATNYGSITLVSKGTGWGII